MRGPGQTSAPAEPARRQAEGERADKPPLWAVALAIAILIALAVVAIDG